MDVRSKFERVENAWCVIRALDAPLSLAFVDLTVHDPVLTCLLEGVGFERYVVGPHTFPCMLRAYVDILHNEFADVISIAPLDD